MGKRTLRLAILFSVLVFLIFLATMCLTGLTTLVLFRAGILDRFHKDAILLIFAGANIAVGTVVSRFVGKRPLATIVELSKATKEVAKGNFNIRLDENSCAAEIRDMTRNFNVMTKELAGTEMLRNDFVENVSHEFKTPVSAIEGYATLLQSKGLSEEKRQEYTQKILHSTRRLSSLTGNILLLSRLENQEMETEKESFSLDEQLRECILLLEEAWSVKQVELDIELDECNYTGSPELLAQVWQNLLHNAIKFVPENGLVRVRLRKKQDHVLVSVSDSGPGMPGDVLGRIFEKFYQGDPSRAAHGNGLGLALARRVVNLHGGEITAASGEGKGTVFTVILPWRIPPI